MTSEHPDAIVYRRTAEAFRTGDLGVVESLIAPDVVWHVPGDHPMAGTIEGRAALLEWLARLRSIGFWLVEQDVFASDEHVCAISTMVARRDDVDARTRVVSIFRYRQGQQLESAGSIPTTPVLERDLHGLGRATTSRLPPSRRGG